MVHSEGSKQCQATGGAIVRFLWSGLDRSYVCSTCVLCVCPGPSCAFLPVESQDRRVGNGFVCHAHLGQEAVGDTGDRRSLEGRGCDGMRGMVIPYRLPDVPSADLHVASSCRPASCRAGGGARWAMPPMGRGNHTMIPDLPHEFYCNG